MCARPGAGERRLGERAVDRERALEQAVLLGERLVEPAVLDRDRALGGERRDERDLDRRNSSGRRLPTYSAPTTFSPVSIGQQSIEPMPSPRIASLTRVGVGGRSRG